MVIEKLGMERWLLYAAAKGMQCYWLGGVGWGEEVFQQSKPQNSTGLQLY